MNLLLSSSFYFFVFQLLISPSSCQPPPNESPQEQLEISARRTRAIAHIFSLIQCFPEGVNNDVLGSAHSQLIPEILSAPKNETFNPENHLDEYANLTEIRNLLSYVEKVKAAGPPDNTPFTNNPQNIANFGIILVVLWRNADNWPIFYSTAAWLVGRASSALLFWALNIVAAEKFSSSVTVPSTVEIFPQLYLSKTLVLPVAGIESEKIWISDNPLHYWTGDPGLNEFHTHFHMDMPFWWNENVFGVKRDKTGELFFYMHHQIINRYAAERLSNWLPDPIPLELNPSFLIAEGYEGEIVDTEYQHFPSRFDWTPMKTFDDGQPMIGSIKRMYERVLQGVYQGYFIDTRNNPIFLNGTNGADILGATVEASSAYSANFAFYGTFHNMIHSLFGGDGQATRPPIPGIQAHQETAMRDRLFYQLHKFVDLMYLTFKGIAALSPPYTKKELEFIGLSILDLRVLTCTSINSAQAWVTSTAGMKLTWPFSWQTTNTPELTTYMTTSTYDISNAARPCCSVDDPPKFVQVPILNHLPFTYIITVQSTRSTVAYGMVRIFLWPERLLDGIPLKGDQAHMRAIEMDRFRIKIEPGKATVFTRSSRNSSLTRVGPSPGIKKLYDIKAGDELLTDAKNRRACAFPNNMLLPKGTREGLPFKLTVYVSEETDTGDIDESQYPHYPLCGVLNGRPFPDKRPMGFPFDRPGTNFKLNVDPSMSEMLGCSDIIMANVKQMNVIIKHKDLQGKMFM